MCHQTKIQIAINMLESHDMLEEAERLDILAAACRCADCMQWKKINLWKSCLHEVIETARADGRESINFAEVDDLVEERMKEG